MCLDQLSKVDVDEARREELGWYCACVICFLFLSLASRMCIYIFFGSGDALAWFLCWQIAEALDLGRFGWILWSCYATCMQ